LAGSRAGLDATVLRDAACGLEFAVRPSGRYRLVRKDERRALIELVEVRGQEDYYLRLETALALPRGAVARMPAHVTLFTEPGGRGIALYSAAELETLSSEAALSLGHGPWRLDEHGAILGA
jgi:hypothetical protein